MHDTRRFDTRTFALIFSLFSPEFIAVFLNTLLFNLISANRNQCWWSWSYEWTTYLCEHQLYSRSSASKLNRSSGQGTQFKFAKWNLTSAPANCSTSLRMAHSESARCETMLRRTHHASTDLDQVLIHSSGKILRTALVELWCLPRVSIAPNVDLKQTKLELNSPWFFSAERNFTKKWRKVKTNMHVTPASIYASMNQMLTFTWDN